MSRLAGKEVRQRRKLHGAVFKIIILMINSNIAGARLGLSHVVTGSGVCAKMMIKASALQRYSRNLIMMKLS